MAPLATRQRKQWILRFSVILLKLTIFLVVFYSSFYCILSVLSGAFSLVYDPTIPFDYNNCCTGSSRHVVVVLSLELNFFVCSALFVAIERTHIWDYALTVSLLHFILSCIVIREPPDNWQWWLAFLSGSGFMTASSVLLGVCWKCVKKRNSVTTSHQD